jgi:hypothetical protein
MINRSADDKSYTDWLIRFVPCYFGSNASQCSKGALSYWRYQYPTNYSEETQANYDAMLISQGRPYTTTNQVLTPKCDDYKPKLYLFDKIDIFNPMLWIIVTIFTFLIPFAFKWYEITGLR